VASLVRADLDVMARDSSRMRGQGPFLFAQVINGVGVPGVADHLLSAWKLAGGAPE
jgi:urease accessory protein